MKSPIIYYGGKTSMLPIILPLIPEHKVYTETFCGGAAVLWAKPKVKNETINDKLDLVPNFYHQLRSNYKALKKMIDATCFSRTLHDKALIIIRNKNMFSAVELAWAFWMTSNFSYGNKIGGGIKYSNDQSLLPPQVMKNKKAEFTEILVARIEHVHIECRDAQQVLQSRNTKDAFHYVDPPYPGADQGHYRGYCFTQFESLLIHLENTKGKFLLSNYNSDILTKYINKNNWWKTETTFNNKGMRKHNLTKNEVLVANYTPLNNIITNIDDDNS